MPIPQVLLPGSIDGTAVGQSLGLSQENTVVNDGAIDNLGVYNITFDTTSEPKKFSIQIGANTGQSIEIDSFDVPW